MPRFVVFLARYFSASFFFGGWGEKGAQTHVQLLKALVSNITARSAGSRALMHDLLPLRVPCPNKKASETTYYRGFSK